MPPTPSYPSPDPALTLPQQIARLKFEALIADASAADAAYDALPESHGGRIISTDLARFLDESYRTHVPGTLRDILPSWESAWIYAQGRLEREIKNRRGRKVLRLMAGGWAAGKTYALKNFAHADVTWDGTLSDPTWAKQIIHLALTHGWKVQIAYVQRPIGLACQGALERGVHEGRMVPLLKLPQIHATVQSSVLELHRLFEKAPNVDWLLLNNAAEITQSRPAQKIQICDIAPGGLLHYTKSDVKDLQKAVRELWQEAKDKGCYPSAVIEAAGQGLG